MELPHIGQTCVICNRNDYLPFKCQHCDRIVCIDHKADHGADCPLSRTSFDASDMQRNPMESIKQSCDFCKKITLKLELSECPHCAANHCLYHRHQVQHDCVKISEDSTVRQLDKEAKALRQREALEQLKEAQAKRGTSTIKQLPPAVKPTINCMPIDPKKQALARRVRIMKIKQSARGPPNVLDKEKIFFEARFQHEPKSDQSNESKHGKIVSLFAVPKHTVGRIVDFASDELDISNKNHIEGADQLVFKVDSGVTPTILDNQKTFQTYIESGVLDSGDQLQITYEPMASH